MTLEYVTNRVSDLCASRGDGYIPASSEASVAEVSFNKLMNMGVVK